MLAQAINHFDSIVLLWSDWMWSMSLHVTWLVVVIWLLERLLKQASARLRFVLWMLVLVRLIIPPGLVLPTGVGWWLGDWFALQAEHWSPALDSSPASSISNPIPGEGASVTQPAAATRSIQWSAFFFNLWLGIVAAQVALMCVGWRRVRQWLAKSTPLDDSRSQHALASAKRRAGIRWSVELRDCGNCTTPLIIGWWRPVILLPTTLRESLELAELESVLVHELMHFTRWDSCWRLLQAILGTLYFFHPAVWFARRKLNRFCEEACDEQTVLALSGERKNYAQAIVKAATLVGYQPPYLALNMVGDSFPVKDRLQRILDPRLPWNSGGTVRRAALALLLAFVLLPSGYRAPEATDSRATRQTGLAHSQIIDASSADEDSARLNASEAGGHADEENEALEQLNSDDFEVRMTGYQTLERVGTLRSLRELESAFLNRRGVEQDAAKRALDRVWSIIRQLPSEATQTTRRFQQ